MRFINLCPHDVTFELTDGRIVQLEMAGTVARQAVTTEEYGVIPFDDKSGIRSYKTEVGDAVNLPKEMPGVMLVVSAIVRLNNPHRKDLVSPSSVYRTLDENGNVLFVSGVDTNF